MEKNNEMPKGAGGDQPKFDVWAYGMASEYELKLAIKSGAVQKVQLMRKDRVQNQNSLVFPVDAELKVLSVKPRRRAEVTKHAVGSAHRELAVEVKVVGDVPKGTLNNYDDGTGLSAFTAGTSFVLVFWPDDGQKMARVSRSCEVLRDVQPGVAEEATAS